MYIQTRTPEHALMNVCQFQYAYFQWHIHTITCTCKHECMFTHFQQHIHTYKQTCIHTQWWLDEAWHALLNEPEHMEICQRIVEWIDKRA